MTYRINLSDKSDRDIRDIYEYIANTLLAPLNAVLKPSPMTQHEHAAGKPIIR